jgi:catechol 2,3-dioxygenase-like lactoylglutathione lyase family enzyme
MLQVKRAGHSTLTTPDIERQIDYFTRIVGLTLVARDKSRAILAVKSGMEAIVLERGSAVEAPRLSFQVAPGSDLGELSSLLKKAGVKSEKRSDITPGIAEAIAFADPKGTTLEIFSDFTFSKPDNTYTGVVPLKLGHIAYQCPDVQKTVKFYSDMLGFRVSDWRGDFFAFMRCSRDHHTVNFLRDPHATIHHIAFEVRDWSDIKRACDMLAHNKIHLTWGPIRHIIGHNIAIYHKNPDGVVIEFFTDMDQMHDEELGFFEPRPWHQDQPQRPKVWGDDTLSNWWGVMARSAPHGNQAAPNTVQTFAAPKPEKTKPAKRELATERASARKVDKKTKQRAAGKQPKSRAIAKRGR